ncbi:hypothetical protein EJ06DRAFT_76604 [Trichodelitschia bisporula]|uniref:Uncharacterized protein n=1 Tax=Trichodelitschia bisporula TaxID=703511 RepID=A0A6G1HT82_9PEZI|nr:hypothetical protein EJ06DRAFT_76604 [Trichodelitschia bisporula]
MRGEVVQRVIVHRSISCAQSSRKRLKEEGMGRRHTRSRCDGGHTKSNHLPSRSQRLVVCVAVPGVLQS